MQQGTAHYKQHRSVRYPHDSNTHNHPIVLSARMDSLAAFIHGCNKAANTVNAAYSQEAAYAAAPG